MTTSIAIQLWSILPSSTLRLYHIKILWWCLNELQIIKNLRQKMIKKYLVNYFDKIKGSKQMQVIMISEHGGCQFLIHF